MRKSILFLCGLLLISMTACGKDNKETPTNNSAQVTEAPWQKESQPENPANQEAKSDTQEASEQEEVKDDSKDTDATGKAESNPNQNNDTSVDDKSEETAKDTDNNDDKKEEVVDKSEIKIKYFPASYKTIDIQKGKIERLDYKTKSYDSRNQEFTKYLNVFLPYGYDPNDKDTKYNVFYLMHGGGENQNTIFGGADKTSDLMKILDNMIMNKEIDPLIVVTPTFYNPGNGDASRLTRNFYNELINDIIPAVEGTYNTYAASTSKEDLIASRDHRAFGGFSMGSACTWYTFINCLDYFTYFMPLSGDCWVLGDGAGGNQAQRTAEYLADVAKNSGYKPDEYFILCATGTSDIAYNNMVPQIEAMKKFTDQFIYTADFSQGNFYFLVKKGGSHLWNDVYLYIYNALPRFFFK